MSHSAPHGSSGQPFAIQVKGLSKRYRMQTIRRGDTVYDKVADVFRRGGGNDGEHGGPALWALRDVSFEVAPGEVLGVIGRNGAGKSTLLKILARITIPTKGMAVTYGRVAALLQVGTGFHPELSGRENIKLSGAILGMSRAEITEAEQEIIDFAEIDRFLDMPVKHYSSGMYLRLAFSVSIHLAAEIMLIDEVLAVGDAAFKKKSEQRIRDAVSSGRTALFVSHSMASVETLCDRVAVLDHGQIKFIGAPGDAIAFYHRQVLGMQPLTDQ